MTIRDLYELALDNNCIDAILTIRDEEGNVREVNQEDIDIEIYCDEVIIGGKESEV